MSPAPKRQPKSRRYVVPVVMTLIFLAAGYGVMRVVTGDSPRKRVMETVAIKLVQPLPPPPKVEPPPPPKMVEEQKIEPPVDKPLDSPKDEPPPGPLALDAKGGAGNDAFGLGGKAGGADFLSGGGGTRFGHFAILMQDRISRSLHDDEKLNAEKFRATIKVWLSDEGKIQRVQVLHGSGDSGTDSRIEQVIGAMPALPEAPPKDMPQPIVVRIGARAGFG
jgi:periplasmic protein TonB